jgi:cellulose biosynthesis protein BcsQ
MENIRILFLDVDGVLNYSGCVNEFDNICLTNLYKIVKSTDCKIIISSTYKLSIESFNRLWNELEKYNILSSLYLLNNYKITSDLLDNNFGRSDEILDTIQKIINDKKYNIISWVAIDDSNLEKLNHQFVKINPKFGLTSEDVKNIIKLML